jgi:hypothetical protein
MYRLRTAGFVVVIAICLASTGEAAAGWINDIVRNVGDVSRLTAVGHEIPEHPAVVEVPATATLPTVAVVSEPERLRLIQRMHEFSETATTHADKYTNIAMGFMITAIALGIAAAIASFCRLSVVAGILSILTTGAIGANNALPFREHANTYHLVSVQARALEGLADRDTTMTRDGYKAYSQKIYALGILGDADSPAGTSTEVEAMVQKLNPTAGAAGAGAKP